MNSGGSGGRPRGDDYQARFDRLAAGGQDVHGEATFVESLLGPTGGTVLDAGCGTGRVAIELARRGRAVVGLDVDATMLATARARAPELEWHEADLADPGLDLGRTFDVVVMAGNVLLFVRPGTEGAVVATCARHLRPGGGRLVAGFQLHERGGPAGRAGPTTEAYDAWCTAAGLEPEARYATWERQPFVDDRGGYHVSVHRRP